MEIVKTLLMIPVAFLVGIIFLGLHRKVIARIQGRPGPPIQQELYHMLKFFVKELTAPETASKPIYFGAIALLIGAWILGLTVIVNGYNLLILLAVFALHKLAEVGMGLSSGSPYGKFGGVRSVYSSSAELPLFAILAITYLKTNSLMLSDIVAYQSVHGPLLFQLPLCALATYVLILAKISYSPFLIIMAKDLVSGYKTEHFGVLRAGLLTGESIELFVLLSLFMLVYVGPLPLWGYALGFILLLVSISFICALTPMLSPHHAVMTEATIAGIVVLYYLLRGVVA